MLELFLFGLDMLNSTHSRVVGQHLDLEIDIVPSSYPLKLKLKRRFNRSGLLLLLLVIIIGLSIVDDCNCLDLGTSTQVKDIKRKSVTMMRAAAYSPGGPENLSISEASMPEPGSQEVRIKVMATAINRADTLQRKGMYNPPPGASQILGLEAAGIVEKVGPGCPENITVGLKVMALLAGGGNAEFVTCRHEQLMPVPAGLSWEMAAAVPEVWLTAFQLLYSVGKLQADDVVLVHAGASGVGTAAVQLITQAGATAIVTAGSQEKIDFAKSLGAKHGFNYKDGSFKDKVLQATDGQGVSLILDCVFGSMFDDNLGVIKSDGRWVVFAFLGGAQKDVNFAPVFRKRVQLLFSNLRFRTVDYKKQLIDEFSSLTASHFSNGSLRPIIHKVLPFDEISAAHTMMESNANIGKIVLRVRKDTESKDEL